jgi:DNA-binding NarL/FixJ family response regulator
VALTKKELSVRQAQVAELVARGCADKVIAAKTGLSIETVRLHVQAAAAKIPGNTPPRHKLTLWFFGISLGGEPHD